MQRFKDKVVIVTGAASGIGRATAIRFGEEAARVFCVDLQEELLQETAAEIEKNGGQARARVCDVSQEKEVRECVADCVEQFQGIDVLAHLAGILKFSHFSEMEFSDWKKIIDVNLGGTFLFCRETIPHLEKRKGCIINASSSSGLVGLPYGVAYSASKGGVRLLTRSLAVEYIKRGVRVNCICPAGIRTPLSAAPIPEGAEMELLTGHENVAGIWGVPDDVARAVLLLASDEASHLNGVSLRVDAGTLS